MSINQTQNNQITSFIPYAEAKTRITESLREVAYFEDLTIACYFYYIKKTFSIIITPKYKENMNFFKIVYHTYIFTNKDIKFSSLEAVINSESIDDLIHNISSFVSKVPLIINLPF